MSRSLALRLRALLLATSLVVGGVGLPICDAILFHGTRPSERGPVRVEPVEAGSAHLLQCALSQAFQRTRGLRPTGTPVVVLVAPETVVLPRRALVAPAVPPATLQLSRAPPRRTA